MQHKGLRIVNSERSLLTTDLCNGPLTRSLPSWSQSVSVVKFLNMLDILTRRLVELHRFGVDFARVNMPIACQYQSLLVRIGSRQSDAAGTCDCP